ncbi:MAG: hypothetical protein FWE59_01305 [Oscillospiraceae bacterium]|nr:hypothetical protein [Oscillospiraceae bacterium]
MSGRRWIKLILFNAGLCLANILLFSNAFWHLDITGANPLSTSFGIMSIVMSAVLFFFVNYKLLLPPPPPPPPALDARRIETLADCAEALDRFAFGNPSIFTDALQTAARQIKRMEKKKATVHSILLERFTDTEMSYVKFESTVCGLEGVMQRNITSLLKRINAFDENEYEDIARINESHSRLHEARRSILRDYSSFVTRCVEDNEEILLRLDKLILEISKLSDIHDGDIESMPAMQEIDALINDTKWYK